MAAQAPNFRRMLRMVWSESRAKKNRLEETVFRLQALVRPRPAYPQWIHSRALKLCMFDGRCK